jgi:tol-pal system protein YbgF
VSRAQATQQQRILELETRIALLEADARRTRAAATDSHKLGETIRLSTHQVAPALQPDEEGESGPAEAAASASPRRSKERVPTLRLYGSSQEALPSLRAEDASLSVVPLPEDRAQALAHGASVTAEAAFTAEYRSALRLVHEQKYDDALAALAAFVSNHPQHALVPNALYWSGEAHYAKREYQPARASFDLLLTRFAQDDKVPDALVKVGLCLRRLGDEAQAQAYFRRVREKFPNTQAAVIASREGST